MNLTSKISLDLTKPDVRTEVHAIQGDGATRCVRILLLADGQPWVPPDGVETAVSYLQPTMHKGLYNLLEDGTPAVSVTGNAAEVILAPQMLTQPGTVRVALMFNDPGLNRLTSFPFTVCVARNPAVIDQQAENYIRLQWLEDQLQKLLIDAAESGAFAGPQGPQGEVGPQGPQGPAGDNTAALEAAQAANSAAENANGVANSMKGEIASLKARMDTFTSLSEGSTTGDAELMDIRVKADGSTAPSAGAAVREQISGLKDDLSDIQYGLGVSCAYSDNRFDTTKIKENTRLYDVGTEYEANGFSTSDYMYVGDCDKVKICKYSNNSVDDTSAYVICYDSGYNPIGTVTLCTGDVSLNENAKFMRMSLPDSLRNRIMVVKNGITPTGYIDYYFTKEYFNNVKEYINQFDVGKVLYVGEGKDYTSITKACIDGIQTPNTVIYIDPGVYDIESEFKEIYGNSFFDNFSSTSVRGIVLSNNIKLIMSPLTVVKFEYDGINTDVQKLFSVFNMDNKYYTKNGFTIIGGKIIARNCRYCVHDDPSSFGEPYRNVYDSIYMYLDNSNNPSWGAAQCIGGGLGKVADITITNCIFESVGAAYNRAIVSYHNVSIANAKSIIKLKDNYFMGQGTARFSYYGESELITDIFASNNNLGNPIYVCAESEDCNIVNMNLVEWNNVVRN